MMQRRRWKIVRFSGYFTDCIARELLKDPGKDVTTIDITTIEL